MKKVIETIGKKVLDEVLDVENNEYEFDGGCYEPWNGISEGPSASISTYTKVFGHYVRINAKSDGTIEALFEDDEYPNLEKAVQQYLDEHFNGSEFLSAVIDDVKENEMDEWQRNGFASASDYYHYRYA